MESHISWIQKPKVSSAALFAKTKYASVSYGLLMKVFSLFVMDIHNAMRESQFRDMLYVIFSKISSLFFYVAGIYTTSLVAVGLHESPYTFYVLLPYFMQTCSTMFLRHALCRKRFLMTVLLKKFNNLNGAVAWNTRKISLLAIVAVISPYLFTSVMTAITDFNDPKDAAYYQFMMWGHDVAGLGRASHVVAFVTLFSTFSFLYTTYNLTVLVYCVLCCHLRRMLMEINSATKETIKRQRCDIKLIYNLLNNYQEILRCVSLLENVFSLPTFLAVAFSLTTMFSTVASVMGGTTLTMDRLVLAENIYFMSNCLTGISSILLCASEVTAKTKNLKNELHLLYVYLLSSGYRNKHALQMVAAVAEIDPCSLSGCKFVFYTRSTILTTFGALFTYSFLIMQAK